MNDSLENRFKGRYPDSNNQNTNESVIISTKENKNLQDTEKGLEKLKRRERKIQALENAVKNPTRVSPAEMKKLQEKLPEFINLIKNEMQNFQKGNETLNKTQSEEYESLRRLLSASEAMMRHFEPENKEKDKNLENSAEKKATIETDDAAKKDLEKKANSTISSTQKTVETQNPNIEKLNNLPEIVTKYKEKIDELIKIIGQIDQSGLDVQTKKELESRVQALLKEIEDLTEQFLLLPEDQTTQEFERAAELEEEMQSLEQQIGTDPNSPESAQLNNQVMMLKGEYQKIQSDINDGNKNLEKLNSEVNNKLASVKEPKTMNPGLKTKVAEVLNNTGTDFKEKFRKIMEANSRTRSIK
jgi:hypothetical protein